MRSSVIFLMVFLILGSCQTPDIDGDDHVLAKVYDRVLYQSELDDLLKPAADEVDSLSIIRSHTDNWVKDQLLLREARLNQPANSDIEKLVDDYRSSLLTHQYERLLIETTLDSTVTRNVRLEYYQNHMDDFVLQDDIYRCFYVKIGLNHPQKDSFNDIWSDLVHSRFSELDGWCDNNQISCLADTSSWFTQEDLENIILPKESNFSFSQTRKQVHRDEEYEYRLWIFDKREQGSISPFDYIKEQIKRVILFKRRKNLLKQKRTELYKREADKSNIKIYYE